MFPRLHTSTKYPTLLTLGEAVDLVHHAFDIRTGGFNPELTHLGNNLRQALLDVGWHDVEAMHKRRLDRDQLDQLKRGPSELEHLKAEMAARTPRPPLSDRPNGHLRLLSPDQLLEVVVMNKGWTGEHGYPYAMNLYVYNPFKPDYPDWLERGSERIWMSKEGVVTRETLPGYMPSHVTLSAHDAVCSDRLQPREQTFAHVDATTYAGHRAFKRIVLGLGREHFSAPTAEQQTIVDALFDHLHDRST